MYDIEINKWEGRLGNNLYQLANAIHFAKETKSILKYPTHNIIKNRVFDFTSEENVEKEYTYLSHDFWDISSLDIRDEIFGNFDILEIAQRHLLPLIPYSPIEVDFDITVHLRGGDVFHTQEGLYSYTTLPVPNEYIQSPASYFLKVFLEEDALDKKILIVAEDRKNPVLDILLRSKYNCTYIPKSLEEDINLLLNSKILIIGGNTTFSSILSMMSPHIKKVYSPLYEGSSIPRNIPSNTGIKKQGVHYYDKIFVYHKHYVPLSTWDSGINQQKLIRKHKLKHIYIIPQVSNTKITRLERTGKMKCYIYNILHVVEIKRFLRTRSQKRYWLDKIKFLFYSSEVVKKTVRIIKYLLKK